MLRYGPPAARWSAVFGGTVADTTVGEKAAAWLAEQLPAMEEALAALVEVNSFTENKDGGARVVEMLREEIASIPGMYERTIIADGASKAWAIRIATLRTTRMPAISAHMSNALADHRTKKERACTVKVNL